jgi:hypothetical protein
MQRARVNGHGGFHQESQATCGKARIPAAPEHLKGWSVKLWGWSLSFSEDFRMLEIPGTWYVCEGKPQASRGVSPRDRPHGLRTPRPQGQGLPKSIGVHIMTSCTLDAGHGSLRFNVFLAGFWSCFGPIPPFYASILPVGTSVFTLCYWMLEVCNFLWFLQGLKLRVYLESQNRIWIWTCE